MPYLLQLVSPNDSAKVRIIFIDANFPTYAFNLFGFYALRWPSDGNREATIFCELLHFLQQLDLFPFTIRSLLRLAEVGAMRLGNILSIPIYWYESLTYDVEVKSFLEFGNGLKRQVVFTFQEH